MLSLKKGEYQTESKIGDGGFGKVFKGIRVRNGRKMEVAIKQCKMLTGKEGKKTPDPLMEAETLKTLCQVHDAQRVIAEYYDSFVDGEYHYLVMEYCKHGSIYDYLSKERKIPFNEEQTKDMVLDIMTALDYIHLAGYLHRDLSPKNILIAGFTMDSVPRVKLVDFGLSKKISQIKRTVAGTPGFYDPERMRHGYSEEVDFYALGCVVFFMLTMELVATKKSRLTLDAITQKMRSRDLSKDALELVCLLLGTQPITNSRAAKILPFFTRGVIQQARIQASSIQKSMSTEQRSPFKEIQNRPGLGKIKEQSGQEEFHEERRSHTKSIEAVQQPAKPILPRKLVTQAKSLPIKITAEHPSKLSIASSSSPLPWPLRQEFRHIVKNVMVNKFGRAILRGPEQLFICETLNFNDKSRCTYVGRLINACSVNQELRIYQPTKVMMLPDFGTYPNGVSEEELRIIERITSPGELNKNTALMAWTMYSKMNAILKAVCGMVRKREENPNLIVDTLAKVTWGGTISVDLPSKMIIRWPATAQGPPLRDYPNLTEELKDMLEDVHGDFSRLFA